VHSRKDNGFITKLCLHMQLPTDIFREHNNLGYHYAK